MYKTNLKSNLKNPSEIAECQVVDIGINGFAECLQKGPNTCNYALPFGYCFLCQHPRLDEIMEKTKKLQKVSLEK